ncbi:UNVERIFIED_CONTAM: hypothetical protein Sradi_2519400 [Sesamum radiatum]|uniref:Retrotransposon Copia-like N-terminal domain-containing protein n=1 Tax=Sesamum radiatum TaxID=300843 RepID=A0AAW2SMU8_SESRA
MSKNPLTTILEANILNGTNYNNWLQNFRIVLNFDNQTYVLDRSLPRVLPEGSTHEERLTFEKWQENNQKYEVTIEKSAPSLLVGGFQLQERKAKGRDAGGGRRVRQSQLLQALRALLFSSWAWAKGRGRRFGSRGF